MGDHLGHVIELPVSTVAHGGVMVARHEGRVVFVSGAIPGEVVRAVVTDDAKKRFWRADTVEVVASSPHRQRHVWSAASLDRAPEERAGGAEFGHIAPAYQRELKRQVLADALQRMAGVTVEFAVEALPGPPDGTGWRTRVRLHADDAGRLGPFAARTHHVVPVTQLPLATPEVAAAVPWGAIASSGVEVIAPSLGPVLVLTERSSRKPITELVGDRRFRLDAGGFWQVHRHAAETLTGAVHSVIDPTRFVAQAANLDLYGGVGLLAAAVAERFGANVRIESVEADAAATGHARANLAEWGKATAATALVDRYLARLRANDASLTEATVVLDPPRSGAGKSVVDSLAVLAPEQVVYVACDPVALARDVALFARHGYRLSSIRAFDMFPNTHHVEAVAGLVRN